MPETSTSLGPLRGPLDHLRICDLSGQLAGAGATKFLAAMGAEVIRVEDPVRQGQWDILRGNPPFVDERRGNELGGGFNNHNVGKYGITVNLRTERGRELLRDLISVSDVVTENFAAGVFARLGFSYETLREITPDIVYVSNCGFGHSGPYAEFKSWGPIVQAVCGLTATARLPEQRPAGYGFSYMDHHGANLMVVALLAAILHRNRTGEGQWIDMAATEAGASMVGLAILDSEVNGRGIEDVKRRGSNRSRTPTMVPHGIYPAEGEDNWIAIACREDSDWVAVTKVIGDQWALDDRFASLRGRVEHEDELDRLLSSWTASLPHRMLAQQLTAAGVPAAIVSRPQDRIDDDASTAAWGLFPEVDHPAIGRVRVDGIPVHLSESDWQIDQAGPLLGEHNALVLTTLLGMSDQEVASLRDQGVI